MDIIYASIRIIYCNSKRIFFYLLIFFVILISSTHELDPAYAIFPSNSSTKNVLINTNTIHYKLITSQVKDRSIVEILEIDTGNRRMIINEPNTSLWFPMFEGFVKLSPNEKYVTYITAENYSLKNAVLWLVDINDFGSQISGKKQLIEFTDELWIAPLVWSPDSKNIAFTKISTSDSGAGDIELWSLDIENRNHKLLISEPTFDSDLFIGVNQPVLGWISGETIQYIDYRASNVFNKVYKYDLNNSSLMLFEEEKSLSEKSTYSPSYSLPCGVSQFSQNDPEWKNDIMRTCGLSIGYAGCALTSTAMVFRYYNVETTPRQLNQCLGDNACLLRWNVASSDCSSSKVSILDSSPWPSFSWTLMEQELQQGRPPILEMCLNGDCINNQHFVVVVSGSGTSRSGYIINDPQDGVAISLSRYSSSWQLTRFRRYSGTPWCQITTCPQSGGVILYWNAGYNCTNSTGDSGYRQRTTTGWQNVNDGQFNDKASSLKVPSGWSVKLFEHADKNGASTCRSGDDSNFESDYFDGGTVGLNDQVSSIEVFNNSNCGQSPGPGWDVRFYNDTNLSSECHHTNLDEPYVFEDWGESSPGGSCNSDNWSARYSKSVYFPGGDYTFGLGSDDWSRIKVGGNLVVNNWEGAGQHYEGRTLSGWHNVEIEFADTLGLARIAAWWRGPGFDMPSESRDPYQWYAEYWGNRDLWWDAIAKVNEGASNLNHNWGSGGPGYNLPVDDFGSRFQRRVYFDCGTYRFHITNDDGVRFWIDDESILDEWRYHVGDYFRDVDLPSGYHELKIEHFEGGGDAKISLDWSKLSVCTPNAPTNILATDGTYSDKVRVTWNSMPGATFYEVFRADSSSGTKSQLTITTSTSHDNTTGTAGLTYYYWVRSGNSDGYSAFSSYNTGWRALPVPSNVQASDGTYSDKVQVTWNSVPDATYYQVWRSDSSGGAKYILRTSTSTTYNDTNATTGRTYYYWLKACSNRCSYLSSYDTGYRSTSLIQSKVFLPVVFNDQGGPSKILSGIVTYKGIPVEGTQVLLRFRDGASWSTYDTTTTDINGKYSFTSFPDLETGQEYYIRWNNDVNTNRLNDWYCDSIYPSTIDPLAYICNFDLENIELLSPDPNTSISLPYTFSWQKRTLTSDDYELHMADMSDGMPWWGTLPGLGYVGSYTLNSLPTNFETGTAYGWYMWVHEPNGHGESYYYRNVTFLNSGAGLDTPAIVLKEYLHRDGNEMNIPGNVQEMGK